MECTICHETGKHILILLIKILGVLNEINSKDHSDDRIDAFLSDIDPSMLMEMMIREKLAAQHRDMV